MGFGDFAIAPSTTATLCAGVPLAKGSEDTFLFGSAGEQASKISSYAIATFSNLTYQRNTRNVVRLGMPMGISGASSALRANYLIFNNSAFEGKNIYCFVDTIDYVNNNTIDVTFTIDAMQTFMFDYELHQCYVEREHSVTDEIGDNVVSEGFGALSTVIHSEDEQFIFRNGAVPKYCTVIYYIENVGKDVDPTRETWDQALNYTVDGSIVNNVYVAANSSNTLTNAAAINTRLMNIMHSGGTIVGISCVPHELIDAGASGYVSTGTLPINTDFVDGTKRYVPKNRKLFTYPYNYVVVSNNAGDERQYRWEWWRKGEGVAANFNIYGGYQPSPECALVPAFYRGSTVNYGEMVMLNNFPTCAWSEDSYLNWKLRNYHSWNQSGMNSVVSGLTGAVTGGVTGAVVGGSVGGIPGAVVGAVSGILSPVVNQENTRKSLISQAQDAVSTPDKLAGNSTASVVNEVIGCTGFTLYRMNICNEQARSIDDFFTMYGYATQKVKIPNRDSRPKFNYVKTQGCTIYGSVPAPFAEEIQNRYNNGVRFWRSSATIGDYTGNEVT